jgi:hypothetical protein
MMMMTMMMMMMMMMMMSQDSGVHGGEQAQGVDAGQDSVLCRAAGCGQDQYRQVHCQVRPPPVVFVCSTKSLSVGD